MPIVLAVIMSPNVLAVIMSPNVLAVIMSPNVLAVIMSLFPARYSSSSGTARGPSLDFFLQIPSPPLNMSDIKTQLYCFRTIWSELMSF